jgi:hypothetical protein
VCEFICGEFQIMTKKLYEVCLSAVQVYSKHHSGRVRTTGADNEEENKFSDISLILDLLMHLLAKDFLDLAAREFHLSTFRTQPGSGSQHEYTTLKQHF